MYILILTLIPATLPSPSLTTSLIMCLPANTNSKRGGGSSKLHGQTGVQGLRMHRLQLQKYRRIKCTLHLTAAAHPRLVRTGASFPRAQARRSGTRAGTSEPAATHTKSYGSGPRSCPNRSGMSDVIHAKRQNETKN
ncbi:hypothetical protein V8F06_001224 [Rhypophila decipiens]